MLLQLRHFFSYEQRGFVGYERILQTRQTSSKPGSRSKEGDRPCNTLSANSVMTYTTTNHLFIGLPLWSESD